MEGQRFYVRHVDAQHGLATTAQPARSYVRDRWHGCNDVATFTQGNLPKKRVRAGYWIRRSTSDVRAHAEAVCALWNDEHDAIVAAAN